MSGSPPEEPSATSGESSRPLESYPPATSSGPATTGEAVPVPASASISGAPQPFPVLADPLPAPIRSRYGDQHTPVFTGSPHLPPVVPPYPLASLESEVPGPATRSLVQKSTRRTKAHVASACVNCKKKHLGCDPARPCRRCVLAGKASSCVDVTHKKRGRPPLKAEDSSLRSYTTHLDNPAVPAEVHPSMASQRNVLHRATSSRELRPVTDLQGIGEPGPAAMRAPRGQPHRWSASVFPLTRPMDHSPPMPPNTVGRRPFSSSGPPSYAPPPQPSPTFAPMARGFNPALKPSTMPPGMERRFPPFAGPALPPPTSPPQHHLPAGVSFLPYAESPSSATHHHPMNDPRVPPGPREPYLGSPVRLPPIHQATASPGPPGPSVPPIPPGPHHAHRLSDPYPVTWTAPGREEASRERRSPVSLQRPAPSVFTHSSTHQRSLSTMTGPFDPTPRHLGPIDLPSPAPLSHPPTTGSQPPQPSTDPEAHESRPVKRRKMALDDMVNG
ncbi:uncharacterized protein N7459_004643 [Penicillium hispanicum]|uniref:uncharacterized protein n=1 Tax=Penicillium hispanicum TaxID=1080232 RepID=UPI0025418999|nr:uncharacterized protein N7459_004643 [Penicillium hispanicum]KAJ5584843.1 hypothetical protein N7459_004643 [Penicillium hispanicum]